MQQKIVNWNESYMWTGDEAIQKWEISTGTSAGGKEPWRLQRDTRAALVKPVQSFSQLGC